MSLQHNQFPANSFNTTTDTLTAKTKCKRHGGKNRFLCIECTRVMCSECFAKRHRTHDVKEIREVAPKYRNQARMFWTKLVETLKSLSEKKYTLLSERENLLISAKKFKDETKICADKVAQIVQNVSEEYIAEATEFQDEQEGSYQKELSNIKDFEEIQYALLSELKEVIEEENDIAFVTTFLRLQNNIKEIGPIPCPQHLENTTPFVPELMVSSVVDKLSTKCNEEKEKGGEMLKTLQEQEDLIQSLKENEEKEKGEMLKTLQEQEDLIQSLNEKLVPQVNHLPIDRITRQRENMIKSLKSEKRSLQQRLDSKTKVIDEIKSKMDNVQQQKEQVNPGITEEEEGSDDILIKIGLLLDSKNKIEKERNCLQLENDRLHSLLKNPEKDMKQKCKQLVDDNRKLTTEKDELLKRYTQLRKTIQTLTTDHENYKHRLSMVAGRKMKDNNPAIADLIDPNHPEKPSEQFREIHDNAWTDVLDYITETEKVQDDVIVKEIVCVLQQIYDQCKDQIANRKLKIIKSKGYPEDTFQKQYSSGKDGYDPIVKIIKDLVQRSANRICDNVIQDIKELAAVTEFLQKGKKKADEFVTKCSMLCLFMVLQDPPVVLDFSCKPGDPFNNDLFSPLTSSGDVIDYLVWPAMFLTEDGALMSKGIAQGKKKNRKKKLDDE